jgi:hypothetical protein
MIHPLLAHAAIASELAALPPDIDFFHRYLFCALPIIIVVLFTPRRLIAIIILALLAAVLKALGKAAAALLLTSPLLDNLAHFIRTVADL